MKEVSKEQILSERAERLARRGSEETHRELQDELELLQFTVGGEKYAISVGFVRELFRSSTVTEIPGSPSFFWGMMNVRGRIVAAIDLKAFLGSSRAARGSDFVIILHHRSFELGVVVDSVQGVIQVPRSHLNTGTAVVRGEREKYILGASHDLGVILDAEGILQDKRLLS